MSLKIWDDIVNLQSLHAAAGVLPPFVRELRSDQAVILYQYVHKAIKLNFSLRDLGFFNLANFDVGGSPLLRLKHWEPAYTGDYIHKKVNSWVRLGDIFLGGGEPPKYEETFPPTYASCWRRMGTMPSSLTYTVAKSSAAAPSPKTSEESSRKKRKVENDLEAEVADVVNDLEGRLGKKAMTKALMQVINKLKQEKQVLENKVAESEINAVDKTSEMRYELHKAKKAISRTYHLQRTLERIQGSRNFYKKAIGDMMNQVEVPLSS